MSILDLVLLAVVAVAAIEGLRLGAVLLTLSLVGFLLGLYLGALAASVTVSWVHGETARTVVALVTMLGVATILGSLGRMLGSRWFVLLHKTKLGSVDTVLGVVVAVAASLLAAWLVASTLVTSSYLPLNSVISGSAIMRSLDRVLPPPPSVFGQVQGFLSAEGFPLAFAQLAPSAGPVTLPGNGVVAAASAAAGPSVVKVVGEGCGQIQEGSGFVAAPDLVVTNAHVVAGIGRPAIQDATGTHPTTVVLFDPTFDLAVLRARGLQEAPLALDPSTVPRQTEGAVLGYPGGGPYTAGPAGVRAEFRAQGRDIYGQGLTVRDVYEIQATVRPGNSGGPLVLRNGEVVGVVFSRSTTNAQVGYALASPAVLARVNQAQAASGTVGTGACTSS